MKIKIWNKTETSNYHLRLATIKTDWHFYPLAPELQMMYIHRYHTFIRRLVFLSWSEVEYIVSLDSSLRTLLRGKRFQGESISSSLSIPALTSVLSGPPKNTKTKIKKKTQKVWNLIVVGLANKQCAIFLRFSPNWEQVVWTNYFSKDKAVVSLHPVSHPLSYPTGHLRPPNTGGIKM